MSEACAVFSSRTMVQANHGLLIIVSFAPGNAAGEGGSALWTLEALENCGVIEKVRWGLEISNLLFWLWELWAGPVIHRGYGAIRTEGDGSSIGSDGGFGSACFGMCLSSLPVVEGDSSVESEKAGKHDDDAKDADINCMGSSEYAEDEKSETHFLSGQQGGHVQHWHLP